jgi:uncharacterized repeat protein (TIGR03803 family)
MLVIVNSNGVPPVVPLSLNESDWGNFVTKGRLNFAFLVTIIMAVSQFCPAQTYSVLYSFENSVADGNGPTGTLAPDASGNLYGTTQVGGTFGVGTIFKVTPQGTESVLYNFDLPPDPMLPIFGLVRDRAGNLYGTTSAGGKYGAGNADGAVFRLSAAGAEKTLHSFGNGKDGLIPNGGLIEDQKGNLYGVSAGGGKSGTGTIFKIAPSGIETILYNFPATGGSPSGTLARDSQGNLYGTTVQGGVNGFGTVYELTAAGKFTALYSFCVAVHCTDGSQPLAGVVRDSSGNLYGTTVNGGSNNQGTVFEVTKEGKETVLHSFGLAGGDGYLPMSGLVRDSAGNLYGTTFVGGAHGTGIIFKIDSSGNETLLYSFCSQLNCADGSSPSLGNLILDDAGNLYGAAQGGANQTGVVFKLTP